MKKLLSKEAIIGFCVILAFAILFFGIEYLKGVSIFKPSNYYYAVYTDAKGLTSSSPVNVNGVKVGQVDDVEIMYDNPGHILVQFSIDKEMKLPVNSTALIDTDILGTASIKLDLVKGTTYYQPGDTVKGEVVNGMMDMISNQVLPGVGQTFAKVDTLMNNLNALTSNEALFATLNNLATFTSGLHTTLNGLNGTIATIHSAAGGIKPLLNDLGHITANVDSLSANLHALSASLNNAPIEETLENVNKISANVNQLTADLNNPDSNIGQLLHGTELYDNLVKTSADIDSLIVDLKRNPKRYISIKLL